MGYSISEKDFSGRIHMSVASQNCAIVNRCPVVDISKCAEERSPKWRSFRNILCRNSMSVDHALEHRRNKNQFRQHYQHTCQIQTGVHFNLECELVPLHL